MPTLPRLAADEVLRNYFRAKDGNRPHLMRDVFCEAATLEVIVNAGAVSFPPLCQGQEQIGVEMDAARPRFDGRNKPAQPRYLRRARELDERLRSDRIVP